MHALMASWSIPWYIWMGLGAFLTLFFVKPAFRANIDALLARMLGMKPRPARRARIHREDEDDGA